MFLDAGAGILSAFLLSRYLGFPASGIWYAAGVLFALLPDADYLFHLLRGGSSRHAHRHRELLHRPLPYLLIGTAALFPLGYTWSLIFAAASLLHFIHDSIGIGWGVQWLWPFRDQHYSFLYIYKPRHRKEKLPRKLLYVWEHAALDELHARYGDEEWIRNIYLRWHPYAVVELAVFLISLIILFMYGK
jgi:hypothetical protein